MGNRLFIGLASLFLLFYLTQGMPLDPRSPLERAVLEKGQQNLCPNDAHPAAKHYHTSYCASEAVSNWKTKRAECLDDITVRLYCGRPNFIAEFHQDIPCGEDEFCLEDDGRNCLEQDHQHMAACVFAFTPNNIDPLHRCYITHHIEIATGAVLLHAHTSGVHANWKDQHSGVAHTDLSYFDEQLYGPTYVDLRVVSPCLTKVYYSLFSGI
ncbi:hypothetical protein IWX90DRAFT_478797 [Phyllosticta citrichinensis]|uniref:Uncharacterized protein n=1 Tax=Phyllosticta citrichinensis TaxID=1130410 RepID=A0ABR1XR35_9PEZI